MRDLVDRKTLLKNRETSEEFCDVLKNRVLIQESNLTQMLSTFLFYASFIDSSAHSDLKDFTTENQNKFYEIKRDILAEIEKYLTSNPESTEEFKQLTINLEKYVTERLSVFTLSSFASFSNNIKEMKNMVTAENQVSMEYFGNELQKTLTKFDGKTLEETLLFGQTVDLDNSADTTNIACAFAQKPSVVSTSSGVKLSQKIIFSGSIEDVNKLKVMYRRVFSEVKVNSDDTYQVLYGAKEEKTPEQLVLLEPNTSIPVNKSAIPVTYPSIDEWLQQGKIPPICMWVSPLEQRVIDFEATGQVAKIETVIIVEEETQMPKLYSLVIYNEGGRVLLNPDGSPVPWTKLPSEKERQLQTVEESVSYYGAAKQNRKEDEILPTMFKMARKIAARSPTQSTRDPDPQPADPNAPATASGAPTTEPDQPQEQPAAPKIPDIRFNATGGGGQYPNFGIWNQLMTTFCWVHIRCYQNYQQGSSNSTPYKSRPAPVATYKFIAPETLSWSSTHTWGDYKGYMTPLAEMVNGAQQGLGKAIDFKNNAAQAFKAEDLKAAFSSMIKGENIIYQKFDQAKVYEKSNDRTISLPFEFSLGPDPDSCARTLWNMIKELSEYAAPKKGDSQNFNFIPPYLFSVHIFPPGSTYDDDGLWVLWDCALVDIKVDTEGAWVNPFGLTPKIKLDLTFTSIIATYLENEPMQPK